VSSIRVKLQLKLLFVIAVKCIPHLHVGGTILLWGTYCYGEPTGARNTMLTGSPVIAWNPAEFDWIQPQLNSTDNYNNYNNNNNNN
jgi:hypothetical protein